MVIDPYIHPGPLRLADHVLPGHRDVRKAFKAAFLYPDLSNPTIQDIIVRRRLLCRGHRNRCPLCSNLQMLSRATRLGCITSRLMYQPTGFLPLRVSILQIFTDFMILVMPLPYVWKLDTHLTHKLALTGVFLLGGLYVPG